MSQITSNAARISVLLIASISILALVPNAQNPAESLLTTENAYNPIPSPDGKYIAYVRTGWGEKVFSSFGRSSLVSDVKIIDLADAASSPRTIAKGYFTAGWTPDSVDIVCYRDWNYSLVSIDGKQIHKGRIPNNPARADLASEWAGYSAFLGTFVWSRVIDSSHGALEMPGRTVAKGKPIWNGRVIPSPNGRYLAVFGGNTTTELRIYDLQLQLWTDLGGITIHPDTNWSYIQPDWNPWFADSSRLVFLKNTALEIATPDGTHRTEITIEGSAGLPTPSPDGQSIAYVTFDPRPQQGRPDLQFWGGTTILVVAALPGSPPRTVSLKNSDEVYDLKWLNNNALVFDRVADEPFYKHARIWRAAVIR